MHSIFYIFTLHNRNLVIFSLLVTTIQLIYLVLQVDAALDEERPFVKRLYRPGQLDEKPRGKFVAWGPSDAPIEAPIRTPYFLL